MNAQEKVATLEALLARVKKNAAAPRAVRPYEDAGAFPPIAAAGEIAPLPPLGDRALPAEPRRPPERDLDLASALVPAEPAVARTPPPIAEPKPVVAEALPMITEALRAAEPQPTVAAPKPPVAAAPPAPAPERPVAAPAKPAPPVAKPPVPAAEPQEKPRLVALAPPIGMPSAANKPAPADKAAASPSPKAAEPAKPARPAAPPRPPLPSRPEPPPSAKTVVEKGPPSKPTPKVETPAVAPKPARPAPRVEPAIVAGTPPDLAAADKPAERIEPVAAARHEVTLKGTPAVSDTLPLDYAPPSDKATRPQEPLGRKPRTADEAPISSAETQLMVGPIPAAARPPPGEEPTVVEEQPGGAAGAQSDPLLAALPKFHEPDEDELATEVMPSSRRPAVGTFSPASPARPEPAARADEADIFAVPSSSQRLPPLAEPALATDKPASERQPASAKPSEPAIEPSRPIPIEVAAPPPSRPVEATKPSLEERPTGRRWGLVIGLAAAVAALIGAGVFVGYRNGWFNRATTPPPSTAPVIRLPDKSSTVAPTTTATSEASAKVGPSPTSSAAATTPSAVVTASAAPATSASAAPSAGASATPDAPSPEGDGTNLPANRGYLVITSAVPASVYANGVYAGLTGQKLDVQCGTKYIRLGPLPPPGAPPPKPPAITWLSEGQSFTVACRKVTTVALEARAQ